MTPTSPPVPHPPSPGRTQAGSHQRCPGGGLKEQAHMEKTFIMRWLYASFCKSYTIFGHFKATCKDIYIVKSNAREY